MALEEENTKICESLMILKKGEKKETFKDDRIAFLYSRTPTNKYRRKFDVELGIHMILSHNSLFHYKVKNKHSSGETDKTSS